MKTTDHMTLEQLENEVWPEPDFTSRLVTTCHRLRKKRLGDFCVEDLRIMLGQSIGAKHLLPRAIEILRKNPLAEGSLFEGDLLAAIARHPENASLLAPKEVMQLLAACVAATESIDPKLRGPDLSSLESLIGELECQISQ